MATGMNINEVRAGDNRVLTGLAHGYSNAEMQGKQLSPFAPVPNRTGIVQRFDDSVFNTYPDDRAPGTEYNQIQTGYTGVPFSLKNKGLMYPVPIEHQEEAATVSINLGRIAQAALMNAQALNIEIEQMRMVTDTANYPASNVVALSGTSQFSNPDSIPRAIVQSAASAIAARTGKRPNVILAGQPVTDALISNPNVQNQFFQSASDIIDEAKLAQYFSVSRYVTGQGVWRNPATRNVEYIWGKNMILAYVDPRALASGTVAYGTTGNAVDRMTQPAAFYSYILQGHPIMSDPFYENKSDTWFYKIKYERGHYVALPGAAYLIQAAVA